MIAPSTTSELLGEIVTWDLGSTTVAYSTVCSALTAAGLDPSVAGELTPRSAFSRACSELKKDRAIDKLKFDHGIATFQFTTKHDTGSQIEYDYECLVKLDTDSGSISCPENPILETQAKELLLQAMGTRVSRDITQLIQKLFAGNADLYAINPKKGTAYFVPDCHAEFTAKVEQFLKHMGGALLRFPVPKGTPQGNASVREAINVGLSDLIGELNDTIDSWDDNTRPSTMEKAQEKLETVLYKIECYDEYLGAEQDRLRESAAKAKEAVASKIAKLAEVQAEKQAEKQASKQSEKEPAPETKLPLVTLVASGSV